MDRLTCRGEQGAYLLCTGDYEDMVDEAIDRLAAYEDTGLEPEQIAELVKISNEYVEASEEGRLIVLSCKVGDTLYAPTRSFVSTFQVTHFEIYDAGIWVSWRITSGITGNFRHDGIPATDIGKTVFLTRAEAEAALGGDDK